MDALEVARPGVTVEPPGPFFARQVRIATEDCGRIDPESVDDYVAVGGYARCATS